MILNNKYLIDKYIGNEVKFSAIFKFLAKQSEH